MGLKNAKNQFCKNNFYEKDLMSFYDRYSSNIGKIFRLDDTIYLLLKITPVHLYVLNLNDKKVLTISHYYNDKFILSTFFNNDGDVFILDNDVFILLKELGYEINNALNSSIYSYENETQIRSGICVFDKKDFVYGNAKPYIDEITLKNFVENIETFLSKQNGENVYSCIDTIIKRHNYNTNGPIQTWNENIKGWTIDILCEKYVFTSGISSKFTDMRMWSDRTSYTNVIFEMSKTKEITKLIKSIGKNHIKKIIVKYDLENGQAPYVYFDNENFIYTIHYYLNKTFAHFFDNFEGEIDDHPFDTSVWGWT